MGGALRSPCPGRRVSPSPGPPELPALRAGCATAGVLRASGPWRARLPWLRASRLEPGGRMELATRSQVRVRRLAAAPTSPGPAFPLLPALLPALGWKRGPWLRGCGSGVPVPRSRRALQVCAVGQGCASRTGEAGRLRTRALGSVPGDGCPGVAGPGAVAGSPRSERIAGREQGRSARVSCVRGTGQEGGELF